MGSKICMNAFCGATTSLEWKLGWELRSGELADLCYKCGSAYESLIFCDMFHQAETGWRECRLCGKSIHCGCIISKSLFLHLDFGGVWCATCAKSSRLHSIQGDILHNGFCTLAVNSSADQQSTLVENRVVDYSVDEGKVTQLCKIMEANEPDLLPPSQTGDRNGSLGQTKGEDVMHPVQEVRTGFANTNQPDVESSYFSKPDNGTQILKVKDIHKSLAQPSLSISLGTLSGTPNFEPLFSSGIMQGREHSKEPSPFQQGQKSRPILPKPHKPGISRSSEANRGLAPQMRVARPPADGRGKCPLLPRYWPRITDQELQQLSGDLNSTIVPLFEKVLSASDAGRIGRLVLPKACAEAYFPPISQSEGLPLKIQDVKGNEWTFQFRFWPNNNSRMYVLEGVTPCIQSMQLQAGDTVIFSRIDPGGKLVMGFRKASNSVDMQDTQSSALANGAPSGETSFSGGVNGNLSAVSSYSGLFQTLKGSKDPHLNALSEHLSLVDGEISWHKSENHGGRTNGGPLQQSIPNLEKKKTRNIWSKSKRLLIHSEDVQELRLTWEEAQDLLRPPPCVKPNIVTIEDHEFEEYDEPPVFGKRTIFTARPSGEQEQWAQCDDCSKWRRLPVDVLLPPKWTCVGNVWDSSRCSCSAPDEMSSKELENVFRASKDLKKRKIVGSHKPPQEHEPSGLDALASAAVLGDNIDDLVESTSIGATTRHPRHRPGCTCIVCIQPPSGKGKHKATCTCNACMTVKRRFKTLMLRKKKQKSEQEAEMIRKDASDINGPSTSSLLLVNDSVKEESHGRIQAEMAETSTAQIDLNCHPNREDIQAEVSGVTMVSLVQSAGLPLENYMKQNGLKCLMPEQQGSLGSGMPSRHTGDSHLPDEKSHGSVVWELESRGGEGYQETKSD